MAFAVAPNHRKVFLGAVNAALVICGVLAMRGTALGDGYQNLANALELTGSTGGPGRQFELRVDYCGTRGLDVTSRCVYYISHDRPAEDQASKYKFSWADVSSVTTGYAPCGNPTVIVHFRHPLRYWSTVTYPGNWVEGKIDEASLVVLNRIDAADCKARFRAIVASSKRIARSARRRP
jgi:hypothetical protein